MQNVSQCHKAHDKSYKTSLSVHLKIMKPQSSFYFMFMADVLIFFLSVHLYLHANSMKREPCHVRNAVCEGPYSLHITFVAVMDEV